MLDKLGTPGHLQPLPDRLGGGVLDAVPDVQALHLPGRRLRPAGDPWPQGIAARGEVRHQYHHCDRHRPDDPRVLRRRDARRSSTASSRPRCPASRCATASTTPTRRPRRRPSTTRCSAPAASGTRAGRRSPSTARCSGIGNFDERHLAALPHRRGPRRGARPRRPSTPRRSRSSSALWFEEAEKQRRAAAQRPAVDRPRTSRRSCAMEFHVPVPPSGQYTLLPGHDRGPRALAPPTCTASRTRSSPRSSSRRRRRGRDLRPRARASAATRCSSRTASSTYVYNFLGIPPEQRISAPAPTPGTHILGVEFTKERIGEHRESHRHREALRRRRGGRRAGDPDRCPATSRSAARASASATTAATPVSSEYTAAVRVHRRHDRQGRLRRRRRRLRRRRAAPRGGDGARFERGSPSRAAPISGSSASVRS